MTVIDIVIVCVLFCQGVLSLECPWRGRFGLRCNRRCSRGCFENRCYRRTGSCINGCKHNLTTGVYCSECVSGSYRYDGIMCRKCSDNCKAGTTCNSRTGSCYEGCKSGWQGYRCDKRSIQCQKGTYVVSSRGNRGFYQTCKKCPTNCKLGTSCNSTTGICDHGCQNGWTGNKCDRRTMLCKKGSYVALIPITIGRFRRVCRKCPTNCKLGTSCNNSTGICDHGCQNGWAGDRCNRRSIQCQKGTYVVSSRGRRGFYQTCKKCPTNCKLGTSCNSTTGICDHGCQNGWTGDRCDRRIMLCKKGSYVALIPITIGRFRRECRKCPTNCKLGTSCNNTTGICDRGCQNGWAGDRCNRRVCKDGTYMVLTLFCVKCPPNCKAGSTCNRNTGTCDSGCLPFWSGDRCNKAITTTRKTTPASESVVFTSTIGRRQPWRKLPTTKTIINDTRYQLNTTSNSRHISSQVSQTMISTPLILKSVEHQKQREANSNGFIIPLAVVSSLLGIVILLVIIHFGQKYLSRTKGTRNQPSRNPPVQCSAEISGRISTIQLDNYFASDLSTKELASHYYLREREDDAYYYPSDIQELVNFDYLEHSHQVDSSIMEMASRDNTRNKHQSVFDDDYESLHFYENPEKQIWQDKTKAK